MDERLKDSVPPHNLEAEVATLGAMLLDWTSIQDVVTFLLPEHFYSLQNQIIYSTLIKLFGSGITGDILTLSFLKTMSLKKLAVELILHPLQMKFLPPQTSIIMHMSFWTEQLAEAS